jgi:dienelactone hydrolase
LWASVYTNGVTKIGTNVVLAGPTVFDGNLTNSFELEDISTLTLDGIDSGLFGVKTLFIDGGITTLRGVTNLNLITPFVYAGTATNGQFLRLTDAVEGAVEFADGADSTKLPLAGGTMTGDISLGQRYVTNSTLPLQVQDLANRRYVDNRASAGGTVSAPIIAPILTVTGGISIADPSGTNPPVWLDYQTLASLLGGDTNAPAGVGGLAAWYQADTLSAGAVATWPDVSGNARDATQATAGNRPVATVAQLNGKTVVRFTRASAHYLQSATFTTIAQPNTIFVVGKFANTTAQNEVFVDGETQRTIFYGTSGSVPSVKVLKLQAGILYEAIQTDTSYHIYEAHANGQASEVQIDGGPVFAGRTTSGTGLDRVNIGVAQGPSTSFCLDGDIAEIIIFDKSLSKAERARVRRYLAHKWGFPTASYTDGGLVAGTFTYPSTADPAFTSLFAAYAYPQGRANLPIVTHMHGFAGTVSGMVARNWARQAAQGAFVVVPSMRGVDGGGSSTAQDASGREIYDINDAINYVRSNFSTVVDTNMVVAMGYSGGAGNAMNYASRFPDSAAVVVDHFGITDYGYNTTWGWYQAGASAGQQSALVSMIGNTPTLLPDNYRARSAVEALPRNYNGHVYMFHDDADTSVPITQTRALVTNLVAYGRSYTTNFTTTTNAVRWTHSNPNDSAGVSQTEAIWLSNVVAGAHRPWLMPTSGTVRVNAWLTSRRGFGITLGTGVNEVADVNYNTDTRSYTVTPLTAPLDFTITQGSGSITRTNVSTATTVTVP